jgi:hypothetical protein
LKNTGNCFTYTNKIIYPERRITTIGNKSTIGIVIDNFDFGKRSRGGGDSMVFGKTREPGQNYIKIDQL